MDRELNFYERPTDKLSAGMMDTESPDKRIVKKVKNLFSVDVEDYFHVSSFEDVIKRDDWDKYKSRIIPNILSLLGHLGNHEFKATFFVLGWVAEKFPEIVSLIHQNGHEIGCHSYDHRLIYDLSPNEFREDTHKCKAILEQIIGEPIFGYRAPSFSLVQRTVWAWAILSELGFKYSSSVYPIVHDRYGYPRAPRNPFVIKTDSGGRIWEIPMSTIRILGKNMPVAGGGYFRLLPYWFTKMAIRRLNRGNIPAVVYIHPWEIDHHQPKINARFISRLRHYTNLDTTESKLKSLLSDFEFTRISDFLKGIPD
jgi:polysaccharide deacetylase family protein (PEP-CTERM system associated)